MTDRSSAVALDQNACGAHLVLSDENTQVQTDAPAIDAHRAVRSQFGLGGATDVGKVEFYLYSPNGITPSLLPSGGVPPACFGLMQATAGLDKYVGEGPDSWSFCPGDGKVRNNGAVVATWTAGGLNATYGMIWDAATLTMTFKIGTTVIGAIVLPSAPYWYGLTVSAAAAGDLAVITNAGQTPMSVPDNVAEGWFHIGIGIVPTFISNQPYLAAPTDPRPNQRYAGDLDRVQQPLRCARSSDFWFWGQSKPPQLGSQAQIQLMVQDPDKIYDWLMRQDIRDQVVRIRRGDNGSTIALSEAIYTAIIDRCEQPSDQTKMLYCGSKLTQLQCQLARQLFAPNADQSVAGKPRNLLLGIGRTISLPMYDAANFDYAAGCLPVASLGKARDQGVELGYGIDFSMLSDLMNIQRTEAPKGKTTYELTTFGGSFNESFADLLAGDGDFASSANDGGGLSATSSSSITIGAGNKTFVLDIPLFRSFDNGSEITVQSTGSGATMTGTVNGVYDPHVGTLTVLVTSTTGSGTHTDWEMLGGVNQPHNWTGGGGNLTDPLATVFQLKGSMGSQYVEQQQTADAVYWMTHQTLTVAPGAAVAFEVIVTRTPYFGPGVDALGNPVTIAPAVLAFSGMSSLGHIGQFYAWAKFSVDSAKTYRGSFVNDTTLTLPLSIYFLCNNMFNNVPVNSALNISSIKLVALPSLTQQTLLGGPGLDRMMRDLLCTFGPLALSDYDPTEAQAIDAGNGYEYGMYISESETPQVADLVKNVCDSAGACPIETRTGTISVFQLTAPEDATVISGYLNETHFNGYLEPWPDYAENLTSRAQGTPNIHPYVASDFANVSLSQLPQVVRNLLMAKFQNSCVANVPLPTRYQHANNAQPKTYYLDKLAHILAEISRANGLYKDLRNFYVGQLFSPLGTLYDLAQVWNVTYPTGNLYTGQNLVIVHADDAATEELTDVVFWGL